MIADFVSTLDGVVAFDADGGWGGGEESGFFDPDRILRDQVVRASDPGWTLRVSSRMATCAPRAHWCLTYGRTSPSAH